MVLKRTINEMSFIWPYEINITNSLSFCVFFVRIHMQSFFFSFHFNPIDVIQRGTPDKIRKTDNLAYFYNVKFELRVPFGIFVVKEKRKKLENYKKGKLLDFIQFYMLKSVISDISYKCMNHVFFLYLCNGTYPLQILLCFACAFVLTHWELALLTDRCVLSFCLISYETSIGNRK